MKTIYRLTAGTLALLLSAKSASALDVAPAGYLSAPGGTDAALLYYQFQNSNKLNVDGVGRVPQSHIDLSLGIARYLHYFETNGFRWAVDTYLTFGALGAKIGGVNQPIKDGIGDYSVGGIFWLTHSDAPTGATWALSQYVTFPTGAYNSTAVSLGSGAYNSITQSSFIQGLGRGLFYEATIDATVQADHNDAGLNISRDASYQFQTYLRYQISPLTNISFGYSGTFGGKSYVNGIYEGLKTRDDELRIFASTFLTKSFQIQGMVGCDINTEGGFKRDLYGQLRLLKVF
jgi:hypothetical protein